jgi:hypothetical protein
LLTRSLLPLSSLAARRSNEQAYLSDGAQRWEWFLLSFELLALLLSAVAILRNRAPAHGAAHPHPHLRASCLALLAVITAISMTETNAKNAEMCVAVARRTKGTRFVRKRSFRSCRAMLCSVLATPQRAAAPAGRQRLARPTCALLRRCATLSS